MRWNDNRHVMFATLACHVLSWHVGMGGFWLGHLAISDDESFAGTFSRRHRWVFVGPCHLCVHGPPAFTLWFRVSHTHTHPPHRNTHCKHTNTHTHTYSHRHTHTHTHTHPHTHTYTHIYIYIFIIYTYIQTGRQTDRQTDKGRHTYRHAYIHRYIHTDTDPPPSLSLSCLSHPSFSFLWLLIGSYWEKLTCRVIRSCILFPSGNRSNCRPVGQNAVGAPGDTWGMGVWLER